MEDVTAYASFESFADDWDDMSENDARMLWQLLDTLDQGEIVVKLPDWLADEKVGYVDGATPTIFVGTIGRETDKAIRLDNAVAARSLLKLANRLHHLDRGLETIEEDSDRREHLEQRRETVRTELIARNQATDLQENWLPTSQILRACRRTHSEK